MLPDPLHPAVVHFPIVLMVLLPFVAAGALWAIRRGARPARAWAVMVAAAAALTLSSWVAIETGEGEEEKVEPVVAEASLHRHEEDAERFLLLSGVLLVITAAGLLRGVPGRAARLGATVGAVGSVAAGSAGRALGRQFSLPRGGCERLHPWRLWRTDGCRSRRRESRRLNSGSWGRRAGAPFTAPRGSY